MPICLLNAKLAIIQILIEKTDTRFGVDTSSMGNPSSHYNTLLY